LRFLPPYVIQKKHVDQVIKALDGALYKNEEPKNNKQKTASSRRKEVHAHA